MRREFFTYDPSGPEWDMLAILQFITESSLIFRILSDSNKFWCSHAKVYIESGILHLLVELSTILAKWRVCQVWRHHFTASVKKEFEEHNDEEVQRYKCDGTV